MIWYTSKYFLKNVVVFSPEYHIYIYGVVLQYLVLACSCNLMDGIGKLTLFEAKLEKTRRSGGQRKTKNYILAVVRLTTSVCSYQYSLIQLNVTNELANLSALNLSAMKSDGNNQWDLFKFPLWIIIIKKWLDEMHVTKTAIITDSNIDKLKCIYI